MTLRIQTRNFSPNPPFRVHTVEGICHRGQNIFLLFEEKLRKLNRMIIDGGLEASWQYIIAKPLAVSSGSPCVSEWLINRRHPKKKPYNRFPSLLTENWVFCPWFFRRETHCYLGLILPFVGCRTDSREHVEQKLPKIYAEVEKFISLPT